MVVFRMDDSQTVMVLLSDVFFDFVFNFVHELLHFALLEADSFLFEDVHDFLAYIFTFLGSEEKTYSSAGYGTAYDSGNYVNRFHNN